jgi:hypothetical protein
MMVLYEFTSAVIFLKVTAKKFGLLTLSSVSFIA